MNDDGAAVFKSSGRNAWPILATNDGFQVQNTFYIKLLKGFRTCEELVIVPTADAEKYFASG